MKGYSVLSETAATHFAGNQSVTVTSLEKNFMRFEKKTLISSSVKKIDRKVPSTFKVMFDTSDSKIAG